MGKDSILIKGKAKSGKITDAVLKNKISPLKCCLNFKKRRRIKISEKSSAIDCLEYINHLYFGVS